MSAAAPAPEVNEAQSPAQVEWVAPKTQGEFRQMVANELAAILSIPENIQAIAKSIAETQVKALHSVNIINQRMEAHPQLVRVEYPNAAKATVVDGAEVGQYDVILEERGEDKEWKPLVRDQVILDGIKHLVLSQVVYAGDVWYVTTTAEVNRYQDKVLTEQYASLER